MSSSAQGESSALTRAHNAAPPRSPSRAIRTSSARAASLRSGGTPSSRLPASTSARAPSAPSFAVMRSLEGSKKWITRRGATGISSSGAGAPTASALANARGLRTMQDASRPIRACARAQSGGHRSRVEQSRHRLDNSNPPRWPDRAGMLSALTGSARRRISDHSRSPGRVSRSTDDSVRHRSRSRRGSPRDRGHGTDDPREAARLGRGDRGAHAARPHPLVRRLDEEFEPLCQTLWTPGTFEPLDPVAAPGLLPRPLGPRRRRARRGPHVHLLGARDRRRPDQQLDATRPRCARRCAASSTARCAGARCTSCRSRWARSARRSRTSASRSPTRPTSRRAWRS